MDSTAAEQDLRDGVAKLAVLHQADAELPRRVVPLKAVAVAGEGGRESTG